MGDLVKEVTAGGKPLKKAYVAIMLWVVGRAIQAAARADKDVKKEFEALPDDFTFALGVLPNGPWMVVGKEDGKVKYLGWNPDIKKLDLKLGVKGVEAAMLMFTFQESTALATSRNRLITSGELPYAMAFIRILDIVETYLLPKLIVKLAVKRYPTNWSFGRKYGGRVCVYTRTLLGF
jgi:hypothetical protein